MKALISKVRKYIPLFSLVVFVITLITFVLHLVILNNVAFADFFNYNISFPVRSVLALATYVIPCSLAELFVLLSPVLVAGMIVIVVKCAKKGKVASVRLLMIILAVACLIFVLFVWTYSSGFHMSKIDDKMNLKRENITEEELFLASKYIVEDLNSLVEQIEYDENGASQLPYSYWEMSRKICDAYDSFVEKYPVVRNYESRIKPIILSEPMTYTHISGIYTYMSGEANVNVNYPDFIISSTAAHEMAHQRGIAREDEANFLSFAVLLESDEPFLKYSAYLDVYSTVLNNLYQTNSALYYELVGQLDGRVKNDLKSYNEFFKKYADSTASEVADSVNNSYLQANGQEQGTKTYGMITELVTAYLLKRTK